MSTTYRQAVLEVADSQTVGTLKAAITAAFSAARVKNFLKAVERSGLRVRHFEMILAAGLLGSTTEAEYGKLLVSDQGQVREFYLATLEKVEPEVRQRFYKLYAYY